MAVQCVPKLSLLRLPLLPAANVENGKSFTEMPQKIFMFWKNCGVGHNSKKDTNFERK